MIVQIKLVSGEELIAELIENNEDASLHFLRNALSIIPTDKGSYAMIPFMALTKSDVVKIKDDRIIVMEEVAEETAAQYSRNFSNLVLPEQASKKIVF